MGVERHPEGGDALGVAMAGAPAAALGHPAPGALDAADEDPTGDAFDLAAVDPEAWRPGIPRWPGFRLVAWTLAIPLLSVLAAGLIEVRLRRDDPGLAWVLDPWRTLAVAAIVGGLLVAWLPLVLARVARGRGRAMLALLDHGFTAGMPIVVLAVVVHALLLGGLLTAAIYAPTGFARPEPAALVLFGGFSGISMFVVAAVAARADIVDQPVIRLVRDEAAGLYRLLDELASRVGVAPPRDVVVTVEMEWWVRDGSVRTLDGEATGPVIGVSLAQLAVLPEPQVGAILAHELAHLRPGGPPSGRIARALDRLERSINALRTEAGGLARIATAPALAWLDLAWTALSVIVAERLRAAHLAADAVAAEVVGVDPVASALVATDAIDVLDAEWAAIVAARLNADQGGDVTDAKPGAAADPLDELWSAIHRDLRDPGFAELLENQLVAVTLTHPATLTRLRALGRADAARVVTGDLGLTGEPAAWSLLADPSATMARLLDGIRRSEPDAVRLNAPQLTPLVVAWGLLGIVGVTLAIVQLVSGFQPDGDAYLGGGLLVGAWLAAVLPFLALQREVLLDAGGLRVRSWLSALRRRGDPTVGWRHLALHDADVSVSGHGIVTIRSTTGTLRWWVRLWTSEQRLRLYEELRGRGVPVRFTSTSLLGEHDPERHAVVYYLADCFVVPAVVRQADGSLSEVEPVKRVPIDDLKLSFALIDRLTEAVPNARERDRAAGLSELAAAAGLAPREFEARARRLWIAGDRKQWTISDDHETVWMAARSEIGHKDLERPVFEILGLRADRG